MNLENRTLSEKRKEAIRRILEAAAVVFAEVGFSGARMDQIAKRAGVNKAMIYYRIGDKAALYERVLHDVFSEVATRISKNVKEGQEPEEKLKAYIHNIVKALEQYPYMPPIMMREIASGGRNFPGMVVGDLSRILGTLMEILHEGAEKGVFVKINPLMFHVMFIAPVISLKTIELIRGKYTGLSEILKKLTENIPTDIENEMRHLALKAIKK